MASALVPSRLMPWRIKVPSSASLYSAAKREMFGATSRAKFGASNSTRPRGPWQP
jgi:hypothetical protein